MDIGGQKLSSDQQAAVEAILSQDGPFLLTGEAGSGKSFVVNYLRKTVPNCEVCAMTGVAAQLINGRTAHSFAGIWPNKPVCRFFKKANQRILDCDMLVIDEISMSSAFFLDQLYERFNYARNSPKLVMVGDLMQLPPVSKIGQESKKIFEWASWHEVTILKLSQQHRQIDSEFVSALNEIRVGRMTPEIAAFFGPRFVEKLPKDCTHLFAKRANADSENVARLAELPGESVVAKWRIGEAQKFKNQEAKQKALRLLENARFPPELTLKAGARIMMLNNAERWVNGSTGEVASVSRDLVSVCLDKVGIVDVARAEEEIVDDDKKLVFKVLQFPMQLAYASTIHKIQGSTLDRVGIDLSGHFETGQTYVALSRCKFFDGLFLTGRFSEIKIDSAALAYSS
jgi:ATP-dependent exoDNAse (exonuclease V) alpha subunit